MTVGSVPQNKETSGRIRRRRQKRGQVFTAAFDIPIQVQKSIQQGADTLGPLTSLTVAKEKGYEDIQVFVDDGISGTTLDRPGFQQMIKAIEPGYISAVLVKDLSRLGRDYLKVGYYTEEFFPPTMYG